MFSQLFYSKNQRQCKWQYGNGLTKHAGDKTLNQKMALNSLLD